MAIFDSIRLGASGVSTGYEIERSVRISRDRNTYFSISNGGNTRTFTFSIWLKLGKNYNNFMGIYSQYLYGSNRCGIVHTGTTANSAGIQYQNRQSNSHKALVYTVEKLRDPASWQHLVIVMDTPNNTRTDRFIVYKNGIRMNFDYYSGPVQNSTSNLNSSTTHYIGRDGYYGTGDFLIAEVNLIDGQAYDASYFGETDARTGQWIPKKYEGSYTGSSYYLKFDDNSSASALGTDSSGLGNNVTANNFSVGSDANNDSFTDTPTNNFCTFNPLDNHSNISLSRGNLVASISSGFKLQRSTFFLSSGKWYWEIKCDDVFPAGFLGITDSTDSVNSQGGASSSSCMIRTTNGDKRIGGSETSYGSGISDGDVMIFALDMDNGKFWAGKNGTFFNSGNPATGSNPATSAVTNPVTPTLGMYDYEDYTGNFGQRKIDSTSYADANGHGAFKYSVPSGYLALCSANLPDPTILLPNKHFDTTLYTGNNSSQEISTLNFQPDWLWFKSRSSTSWHGLFDSVRGRGQGVTSNNSNAEYTSSASNDLVSFDDDGFTLGSNQNWGSVNGSGNSIVTWAWNGGDTDGKTYAVTVVSDSGNKYRFDGFGTSAVTLDLAEGGTYIFDQSDSSNSNHPLRFSTTSNGTHGGGSEYTTGVTTSGTPGSSGAFTKIVVAASAPTLYYYCTNHSGMGGQANTNSTLGSSNFNGTIQSTAKVNASAGFSIVTWTIPSDAVYTIGHGLGVAPKAIFMKARNQTTNWDVFHAEVGNTKRIKLNSEDAPQDYTGPWNDTDPTSTVFTSTGSWLNGANSTVVAYVFSEVAGYSKFGSYTGNGSDDGSFVFTGFRPAWVLIKNSTSGSTAWIIKDAKIDTYNVMNKAFRANTADAEASSLSGVDFLSNGFKIRNNGSFTNQSGQTYIYFAFAESPFKNARAR